MALVAGLEKPIGPDSPFAAALLNPRPHPVAPPVAAQAAPKAAPETAAFMFAAAALSPEQKEELREAYWQHVASPVPQKFGGEGGQELSSNDITTVIPGRAWVVPSLLGEDECAWLIQLGEEFGMTPASAGTGVQGFRTSKRTNNYCNPDLSALVGPRLPAALLGLTKRAKPYTAFRGIHPNWRLGRYDSGDFFAAHYDQADSLTVRFGEGGKERYDSSHTLLISLSERSSLEGGATRLWPTGRYDDTAVDVELPRGCALVFEHKLLHSGLAVRSGVKHIAQAGLLRGMPDRVGWAPSIFRLGPGIR